MHDPIIQLEAIHKHYGLSGSRVAALRGIDLRVRPRDFLAITGPSGSGKSTLMNVNGCLDVPDRGTYHLNGRDVAALSADALAHVRNQLVGFVFQGFNLLPRTTALENVETPMLYAGVGRNDRQRRAKALLARFGLGDRAQHLPNQLSGGQQQRVAIARALANDPAILLADEPTGNLDSATGVEVMDTLEELNRREGLTIILITHEAEVAARAQRTLTVRDGQLEPA